jgi:hypothetical protein
MPGVNLPQVGMNYVPSAIGTANIGMPGVNLPQADMNYVPGVIQWGEPRQIPFPEPGLSVYFPHNDTIRGRIEWGPETELPIPPPIVVLPGSEAAGFGTGLN